MKKRLVSLMCASALVFCCGLSGCAQGGTQNSVPQSSQSGGSGGRETNSITDTQEKIIFEQNGKKLYRSGAALFVMNDNDNFEYVEQVKEKTGEAYDNIPNCIDIQPLNIISNNDIYGFYHNQFCHWDVSDFKNANLDVIYTEEQVQTVIEEYCTRHDIVIRTSMEEVSNNVLDNEYPGRSLVDGEDGFVYYSFIPNASIIAQSYGLIGAVFRFAKDGSKIEILDSIRAVEIAYCNGFLFYFDPCFVYEEDKDYPIIDSEHCGIYRSRPDGSEKQKLSAIDSKNKTYLFDVDFAIYGLQDLNIINDKLFFVEKGYEHYSHENGFLYSLSLKGGDPQKVISDSMTTYYLDLSSNKLYYRTVLYNDNEANSAFFKVVSLGDGKEQVLFEDKNYNWNYHFMPDNDYLYFEHIEFKPINFIGKQSHLNEGGRRYNCKANKTESLYCTVDAEFKDDENGVEKIVSAENFKIYWEEE